MMCNLKNELKYTWVPLMVRTCKMLKDFAQKVLDYECTDRYISDELITITNYLQNA